MTKPTKRASGVRKIHFTNYYEVEAQGNRIGLVTCMECGAAVIFNESQVNSMKLHEEFHTVH